MDFSFGLKVEADGEE